MRHIIWNQSDTYPLALLIKSSAFVQAELEDKYLDPMVQGGIPQHDIAAWTLEYNGDKASATFIKEYLKTLLPALDSVGTKFLYCADANYFKVLTKKKQAEKYLGYILPCAIEGYEHLNVVLGVNHRSVLYNPNNLDKLILSVKSMVDAYAGKENQFTNSILKNPTYPKSPEAIAEALQALHSHDHITCDIETASLHHATAGIATIGFSWDHECGVAFAVDYVPTLNSLFGLPGKQGVMKTNVVVRQLLKDFFESYKGTLTFHKANFDIKVLIYNLWMGSLADTEGMLTGLNVMTRSFHDTKIIAYLSTNNAGGNELGLKKLAHSYVGNYAVEDIKDVLMIPLPELLEYNLTDCCATYWTYLKHYPKMVEDQQLNLYNNLMLPSQKIITHAELTGMPLNPKRVKKARKQLEKIRDKCLKTISNHPAVIRTEELLTQTKYDKDHAARLAKSKTGKIKIKDRDTFPQVEFNTGSGDQLATLLYETLGLPILERTDTGLPATGGKVIKALLNHTQDSSTLDLLEAIRGWGKADKILTTFIVAFEESISHGETDIVWVHGSLNLGGTVSGRLSSSDPNLQNIPSGSAHAKLIKSCFMAPKGWLFCGADFSSLEDKISALTTRDPNKLKVYEQKYDGHSLRAFAYFKDELPGIVDTVESINSIEQLFPKVRQDSKAPTFLLTYGGTHFGLMKNCGFSKPVALQIEENYHELYVVSDRWVQENLDRAKDTGYVTCAFGLRVRTPLLSKTMRDSKNVPYESKKEGRTAGNALGQSYGLLNNRAAAEFMERVWASDYKYDIKLCNMIHDAIYILVKDNIDVLKWANDNLVECMEWQELPEIQHDTVKLGANLDVHYDGWHQPITLPNKATATEIQAICVQGAYDYNHPEQEEAA